MRLSKGFTLVELLLALALVGTVSLLVVGGTRFAALGLDRTAKIAERMEWRRNLDDLLQRQLSAALAPPLLPNQAPLIGRRDAVEFLTVATDGGAGLYRASLAVETADGERQLVLRRQIGRAHV